MKDAHIKQDVFSAYLDGEATPEERADLESGLPCSDESRTFLNDFQRLGDEIRSLPSEKLPADFSDRVLAAVEREMLLPPASQAGPQPETSRHWLRNLAALTATAAALVMAVVFLNPAPKQEPDVDRDVVINPPKGAPAFANVESKSNEKRNFVAKKLAGPDQNGVNAGRDFADQEPLIPPIAIGEWNTAKSLADNRLLFYDNLQKLSKDDVGRVVTAMEMSDQGISIVKLTVVDCREGLNALQVLLTRHNIERQPGMNVAGNFKKFKKDKAAGQLMAVYVRSTSDRLASAVAALKADRRFRRLEVDAPISPSRLPVTTQRQLARFESRRAFSGGGASRFLRSSPPRTSGKKAKQFDAGSPGKGGGGKGTAAPQKAPVGKARDKIADGQPAPPFFPKQGAAFDTYTRIAQQLQLTLPADALQRETRELLAARQKARNRLNAMRQRSSEGRAIAKQQPLRVLFLLECPAPQESGATSPADAASSKKNSSQK